MIHKKLTYAESGRFRASLGSKVLLFATIIALVFAADPTHTGYGLPVSFQFVPVIVALFGSFFYFYSGFKPVGKLIWQDVCFFVLSSMILIGGSLTAINEGSLSENFLRLGIASLMYVPFRLLGSQPAQLDWFVRKMLFPLLFVSMIMAFLLLYWELVGPFIDRRKGMLHIYHEEVFFFCASACIATILIKNFLFRVIAVFLLLTAQLIIFKNTGFIVFMTTIFFLYLIPRKWVRVPVKGTSYYKVLGAIFMLICFAALVLVYSQIKDTLPGGSTFVRFYTYGLRWEQFRSSPILGDFFMGNTNIMVPGSNLYIPSHSDFLDLLAFGGVVGTLLFFAPLVSILFFAIRTRNSVSEDRALLFSLAIFVPIVEVMFFNPILLQPRLSLFVWISFAILVSIRSRHRVNA